MEYEAVIGLEVHAQLLTKSKMFCGCSTQFGAPPNVNTCPVCLGMPGTLPVPNKKAIEFALKTALALDCEISPYSVFARKNYFYPDLPKNYQISQYELPLACNGAISIEVSGKIKKIGITRIHLEEDAGKLLHEIKGIVTGYSYVDFNRTGVPLLEIVSEPEICSGEEASIYLQNLRSILRYLEVCDGNMEEGSLRCDANISLRPKGQKTLGTKTELKNMNSFKFVRMALDYEIQRQREVLEEGGTIVQETRLFDPRQGITIPMRGKEEAHDYRYFPDPDLIPIEPSKEWIEKIKASLPELPQQKVARFIRDYNIPEYDCKVLVSSRALANYFEECVKLFPQPKTISNWIMTELMHLLKKDNREIEECPINPQQLAGMFQLIEKGTISAKIAKQVFEEMYKTGLSAEEIVKKRGLIQVSDQAEIEQAIIKVLAANPDAIEKYRAGNSKVFGFFVGEVMKQTKGKANPKIVNQILREKLAE
ncbi:MAG: Asp-tRNA(Asn)/Glu-tRNA(Gln) amidotransferase subunit GatB [Desulfobacterota bacterium]|nr:Asp-tRNA(Asn)/Glu-tRNA(Gln) amidotransferase subunit GatB [Thermodesulfobacteriota bacterium]